MDNERQESGQASALAARRQLWKTRLKEWKTSGLSQAAFCRQHGMNPVQFSWWKRRLGAGKARSLRSRFVAARIVEVPQLADVRVAIELRGGRRVEFSGGLDARLLRTLFELLETLP